MQVSGTIGARNNGFGVFGVLPNVKILPIKVLGNDGGGSMSDIMAAIDYVATNAVSLGIGVINLSLGGTGSVRDPICQSIQAATTRGVVVVVAAGNDGDDLAGYSPASCPATIAVTAISPTANTPAGFSNWLNPGASAAEQRRVVAAPGVNILSTLPDGSYDSWQGTSMASPHVAGAAARCFAAGECKVGDGAANRERFLNSIWAKYDSDPAYRWTSARTPVASGKWYGPLVWADKW
jgi:subtilisin family serine protease